MRNEPAPLAFLLIRKNLMAKILVVDDDIDICELRKLLLHKAGHTVRALTNATDTENELRNFTPDLVITDIMMPGVAGGAIYALVRAILGASVPVIVSSSTSLQLHAEKDPFLGYAAKHAGEDKLCQLVEAMLKK
jgi:CheY-like chemotaxis protein